MEPLFARQNECLLVVAAFFTVVCGALPVFHRLGFRPLAATGLSLATSVAVLALSAQSLV